jgi:hypothetical protein
MDATKRAPAWLRLWPTIATAGLLIIAGCALDKNGSHPGNVVARIGGHSGQLIEPKRCLLKIAIVTRPFGDRTLNEVVWRVADEQVIPPAERRAWEVNGLRVGRIVGELPLELEAILKDTSPQNKVNPTNFVVDSGEPTLIAVGETVEQASLLLNRENRIVGRDYQEPSGFFRLTPQHDGSNNVSLRMVPEIHHGPIQRTFQALPNATPLGPQEFRINNGQQEETIREMATTLVLEPGQVALIGCRPEFKRSLGSFMLTQAVAHSDQRIEKLVMIWASRNLSGQANNDDEPKTTDRPKLFQRLIGPTPTPTVSKSNPPAPEIPQIDTSVPTGAFTKIPTVTKASSGGQPAQAKPTPTPPPSTPATDTDKSNQSP